MAAVHLKLQVTNIRACFRKPVHVFSGDAAAGYRRRLFRRLVLPVLCVFLWMCGFGVSAAHASVSLLLEQPYGGFGAWNPTGHSALYFDHICAATPVELRPCGPGELGVVISRYDGIKDYDWIAIPLVPYLYAVNTVEQIPSSASRLSVIRMRDMYRREHLETLAPDTPEGGMPQGNWYELVGSAYDRSIYGFRVRTTPEQDAAIIAMFNDRPNVTRYSGAFRNCADFVRTTINDLYPHAVRRNFIADFGISTPKSVARGLTHYARKHPDADLQVFQIRQVRGDLPRSLGVEDVSESLLKRYGVPIWMLSPHVAAAVLVAYVGHGRFAVPKKAPVLDFKALEEAADKRTGTEVSLAAYPGVRELPLGVKGVAADRHPDPALTGVSGAGSPAAGFVNWMDCPGCGNADLP